MNQVCDQLDAYLLVLLTAEDRAMFAEHLAGCTACQNALDLQRRIDGLLGQAADLEPAPPLGLRFKRRLRVRRFVRGGALAGLLLAVVWFIWPRVERGDAGATATAPDGAAGPRSATVSVQLSSNVIARPLESNDPRVTIVWTYPVLEARPLGGS
ncbi:MAG: zf-HC2 domain-containing protein [Pirellulales bacterium]